MRIVLPEGQEERILRAAEMLNRRGVAEIILLGNLNVVKQKISDLGLQLSNATNIQPELAPEFQRLRSNLFRGT